MQRDLSGNEYTEDRPKRPQLQQRALVLCGRYDGATPRMAELIATEIPNAELAVFEASSHTSPIEEPDRYVATIRGFLRRFD